MLRRLVEDREAPARLRAAQLADHLVNSSPTLRALARTARQMVLDNAPAASESIRFGCLCYFHPGAAFGAIGGNVCMIEMRGDAIALSFIHGAALPDPEGLLQGRARSKRFVAITGRTDVHNPAVAALVRAAYRPQPAVPSGKKQGKKRGRG